MTVTTFAEFGLAAPLLAGLAAAGFDTPTPIQAQAIGPQMAGRDILGIAQTGTGKTAAFGLPILNAILAMPGRPAPKTCRALILAPTRELAVQILDSLKKFAGSARISSVLVLGGMSRYAQVKGVSRGVDFVVATPGRITDLVEAGDLRLDETRFVVLDEADRMLDMGFIKPVRALVARLHPRRQSALFSATMPNEVAGLAASLLRDPVRVEVTPPGETVGKVEQRIEMVSTADKRRRLAELVSAPEVARVLVFARTKRGADRVAENLEKDGIAAEAIHGNKAQNARQRALDAFRSGRVRVLVATDIAARGIDVPGITHVINHDLPDEPESYVHRIGRTGRNGADGVAVTLCAPDERDKLRAVERVTRLRLLPGGAASDGPAPKRADGPRPAPRKPGPPKGAGAKPGGPKPADRQGADKKPAAARADGDGAWKPRRPRRRTGRSQAA